MHGDTETPETCQLVGPYRSRFAWPPVPQVGEQRTRRLTRESTIALSLHLESYYEALAVSSVGWERGENDEAPFVRYMLGVILYSYRELFARIDGAASATKADRVRAVFDRRIGKVTKADIREDCPDISDVTIGRELKRMLEAGEITKVGAARATGYVKMT